MIARLDYGWRLFATGASLAFFALCGSAFSLLAIVASALWSRCCSASA